jgi:hypothetical protein
MALELPLSRVQRWLQAVVVHPGSAPEALASPSAAAELSPEALGELILPSRTLTPVERVGIYRGMYPLRMEEALATDYPARSYSLNRLGDHLPEYVRGARGIKRPEFCYELARLELAVSEVFDAPDRPALEAQDVARVAPEAWERARLQPIDAFRLLSLRYPANEYLQSLKDEDHDHPRPRLKPNWLAVYRSNYSVYRLALSRAAHDLLADLAAGHPLGEAVAAALARGGRRAPSEDELHHWFRGWVSAGLFHSVRTADERPVREA